MDLTPAEKRMALLVNAIAETVEQVHPEPAPESALYVAFQAGGFSYQDFETAVNLAVSSGMVRKGSVPHTLEAATS